MNRVYWGGTQAFERGAWEKQVVNNHASQSLYVH